ncbi:discoidin domain-containing protein [Lachnospiraceae bacterium 46-15]
MKCMRCGCELPSGAAFCGECGARAAVSENGASPQNTSWSGAPGIYGGMPDAPQKKSMPDVYKVLIIVGICVAVGIVAFAVKTLCFSETEGKGKTPGRTYAETDKAGLAETESAKMTEGADEKSGDEQEGVPEVLQKQVAAINERYNEIEKAVSSGSCEKIYMESGIMAYYDGEELKAVKAWEDIDGVSYDCSYYYEDGELFYAYYVGEDEYKFYFRGDRLIQEDRIHTRVIESSNGQETEADSEESDEPMEYEDWEKKVLSAGRSYIMEKEEALRLAADDEGIEEAVSETDTEGTDDVKEMDAVQTNMYAIQMENVAEVSASSSLSEYDMTHEPQFLTDGKVKTAWVEGAAGQGIGESVTLYFDDVYQVTGFDIYAGYHKSKSLYHKNSRPKEIYVEFSDGSGEDFVLKDQFKKQNVQLSHPVNTAYVAITIKSVYPGSKFEDTVISEIELY